jgi:threonine/homoserine/homoserine lactone efflux protein
MILISLRHHERVVLARILFECLQSQIDNVLYLGFPGFVRHDSADPNLFIQFAQLGTIYAVIAIAVHASIVILAGKLRLWLLAGPHRKASTNVLFGLVIVAVWLAWTTRRV